MKHSRTDNDSAFIPKSSLQSLPPDILFKILQGLPDHSSVFSLLQVLGTADARGVLESLWQLGRTWKQSDLWPTLHLGLNCFDNDTISHLEVIAPLYTHVILDDQYNIEWLQQHLHPTASLDWRCLPGQEDQVQPLSLDEWYAKWATSLRTTRLTISERPTADAMLVVAPSLVHLTRLTLRLATTPFPEGLFAWLPTSSVIDLDLTESFEDVFVGHYTMSSLQHLRKWLETCPVRSLKLIGCEWSDSANAARKICDAMFACQTLEALTVAWYIFPNNFFKDKILPASMTHLALNDCGLDSQDLSSLTVALEQSNVTHFELQGYSDENDEDDVGFNAFLRKVAETRITHLDLTRFGTTVLGLEDLALFDPKNHLETLILDGELHLHGLEVKAIAEAMAIHPTLRYLSLADCQDIEFKTALELLPQAQLPAPRRTLNLGMTLKMSSDDVDRLHSIASERGIRLMLTQATT
ncbi:Aste57867_9167 [Aphanomyces stellatus]|uniref:Aste57867_9167 protein n=1 Tax=Aphanomyces stellatus TaxID=120398 RepID=A0A485KMJ7_9STRA|nr:hypothetical protein As57867_009131 [Aphanomyces stellatus]VFT86051.1 Aste57867_9167 [Aphanomyces stellatus]